MLFLLETWMQCIFPLSPTLATLDWCLCRINTSFPLIPCIIILFFFLSWAPSVAENLPLWHIQNVLLKIKVIVFCFLMQMASHMACKCIWGPEDEEHVQLAAQTCTETLNRNEGGAIKMSPWPLVYLSVFLSIKKSRQSLVSGRRACVFSAGFLKLDHMLLLIIKLYGQGILYSFF